ncbi:MAG TPA: hypothetical protein PLS68_06270 [Actinotalea sp.]|nr:hypothetical protein [Actinotalea sp.]
MDTTAPDPDEIARLAQADPAAGLHPDAAALRAAVDARTTAVPDQLAVARSRRWTSWPARVAGIAAAALVVGGGGGYAIGAAGSQPELAAAAITLTTGPSGGDAASSGAAGAPESLAVPDAGVGGAARTADMSFWGGWGRTVFTSSGLSDEGGSHAAWALDAASVFSDATIAAAAAALGVAGSPEMTYGSWSVGATDGTGPVVTLSADGTASLGYYDPTTDPWSCTTVTEGGADGTTEEGLVAPEPCVQRDLGPAPQGEDASARLRALLGSLGQDAASFELVAEDYGDIAYAYVTAYQVIDGQRTGLAWSASFTGAGLQSLYGSLAPAVALGEYAVISPVEAVERLGDPRFGFGWGGPIAYADGAAAREGDMAVQSEEPAVPTVPPTAAAGSSLSWPVTEVTIVSARLGVALHTQADGAAVLAPTYELTSADGGIWTVLAVADSALDFSAVG